MMKICGARTSRKNSAGGQPCKIVRVAANGRCRFHGGYSTGPRTLEGRKKIAQAQRKRWAEWKAANPKLFHDISDRQERNIKRAFRQREVLKCDTRSWIERKLGANWREIMGQQLRELEAENARARERNKPLTPEQIAQADSFLKQWAKLTGQPNTTAGEELRHLASRGYTARKPMPSSSQQWVNQMLASSTTRPVTTGSEQVPAPASSQSTAEKLQAQIERQPISRIKRLEYADRQRRTQAHGEELAERYGLNKRRPSVRVGYASKKRR